MDDDVLIGVDPHKARNTLVVMDPANKTLIAKGRFVKAARQMVWRHTCAH